MLYLVDEVKNDCCSMELRAKGTLSNRKIVIFVFIINITDGSTTEGIVSYSLDLSPI
jgi:hypothetical protein